MSVGVHVHTKDFMLVDLFELLFRLGLVFN